MTPPPNFPLEDGSFLEGISVQFIENKQEVQVGASGNIFISGGAAEEVDAG